MYTSRFLDDCQKTTHYLLEICHYQFVFTWKTSHLLYDFVINNSYQKILIICAARTVLDCTRYVSELYYTLHGTQRIEFFCFQSRKWSYTTPVFRIITYFTKLNSFYYRFHLLVRYCTTYSIVMKMEKEKWKKTTCCSLVCLFIEYLHVKIEFLLS